MIKPAVDIIILNWNGMADTIECLESIRKLTYTNYRIILVDNDSIEPELDQILEQFTDLDIVSIQNSENLGFAGGCNVAIKRSLDDATPYFLLLNNDTAVKPDFLDYMVETAQTSDDIAVVGSKIMLSSEPRKIWTSGIHFNYYFPPLSTMVDYTEVTPVNGVTGCCMLVNTSIVQTVGMLDEDYFAYSEEDDLNLRFLKAGKTLLYDPRAVIWHKVSGSTGGGFNPTVAYFKMRNKILFAKKNYGFKHWPSYFLFLVAYFFKCMIKAVLIRDWKTCRALLRGVKDAL